MITCELTNMLKGGIKKYMDKVIKELLEQGNFRADEESLVAIGKKGNFPFMVTLYGNVTRLIFSVCSRSYPDVNDLKRLVKETSQLKNVTTRGYHVEFIVKGGLTAKAKVENILAAAEATVSFLSTNGYAACCEATGEVGPVDGYVVGGVPQILSEKSFAEASQNLATEAQIVSQKRENILGGIIGALLGSLIGVVAIVIIARMGYVSAISGVMMGVCTLKGYAMVGGKFTKKGIVISLIIMAFMVYLGNNIDWAITISQELGVGFFEAFGYVKEVFMYPDLRSVYYQNIGMLYLFTALGAIPTILGLIKENNAKHTSYRI